MKRTNLNESLYLMLAIYAVAGLAVLLTGIGMISAVSYGLYCLVNWLLS